MCPSPDEVRKYLDKWNDDSFSLPEKAMMKLFKELHENRELEDILIKIYALNDAYKVGIFWPIEVAKHIKKEKIDAGLSKGELEIVNRIRIGHGVKTPNGNERDFYSFATKYCSFHNPDIYPIYDSNVARALKYFSNNCPKKFSFNGNNNLRNYGNFLKIIKDFQKNFGPEKFSLRDIDKYLYLKGRELA
ncbi:hypothetical protein L0244_36245 [bacterium]|nr:hypothetical protein [bacterium]